MIGNRFYTWFKNYYQWVGGAFNETLLLPLVRATAGLRAGAIRYDETTNTVETYDGTNWNAIPSASGFVPTSRTITINGTTFDLSTNRIYSVGTVTSVGLSMPAAFTVSGSPVTGSGTLSVAGAGLATQYVRGDGTLANFPTTQGGGSSVSYYLNGSVNQGTFGGATYYEMNRTPVLGAGTNFSRNTDGYIASFITDANDPALTEIPGGNFNFELYFSASSGGGNPSFYVELYKYDGTNFSLIASNSTSPDSIVGSAKDAYFTALAVPQTTLAITDRLAIRVYVNTSGRTITLHTEDQNLCQVITTFSTGINTINGLTKQVQFLTTGTSGTDFNINSTNSTHTFNIPTASATNRGALSSTDWTTFNNKVSTSRQLTINGTAFDLSADRSWNVGTVTSVGLNTGSAGTDINVSGSPVNVSGNITLNIPTASATNRGALSAADWAIFNAKQNALTLTTTGNSGASTLVGATLNVPEYTLTGLGGVPTTRTLTINGTALDLSANRSWSVGTVTSVGLTSATSGITISDSPVTVSGTIGIAIATANGSQQGLLSSTDWTTFNNKQNTLSLTTNGTSGAATLIGATLNVPQYQAQGNYITSLTGEATASGPGAASVTLSTTAVTGKLLTGLNLSGGGTIAATDSILQAFGKVQNQISAMVGGVMYQGTWNASTNTPTLTSSVGTKGNYYIVDVSGTTNLNGITDWRVGDWAIFNGSTWDKVDNTDAVSSVNGFTGAVSLTTSHIAEGTNLYYLDSRSRTAISLTTTGNSGAATYDNVSGIINVPQYTLAGLGGVPTTRQLTINGTAFDLSADRSWSVGTVTSVGLNSTTSGITITNTPVTSSGALTINIATASGSQNGLLSSTDWTTFNNKQNALNGTGFVKISGTTISYDNSTYLTTGSAAATYVPYSNATSGVNLGIYALAAKDIDINGNGTNQGGILSFAQYNASSTGRVGFTTINAIGQNNLWINFAQASAIRSAVLDSSSITDGAQRFYTLPNASGTLALTSNINSAVSGSAGQVAYFSGANSVTGESNLFWDASNDRLGIGTALPAFRMQAVVDNSYSTLVIAATSANGNVTGGLTFGGIYNSDNLNFYSGGSFTSKMILNNSGNLGLGVTPSAWFAGTASEVGFAGNAIWSRAQDELYFTNNYYRDSGGNKFAANGRASFYLQFQGQHQFYTSNTSNSSGAGAAATFTQAMTLSSAGYLGIGSTNPYGQLTIQNITNNLGGLNFTEASDASSRRWQIRNDVSVFGDFSIRQSTTQTGTTFTDRLYITSGGNVGIGTTSPNNVLQVGGTVNGIVRIDGAGDGVDFGIKWAASNASIYSNTSSAYLTMSTNGNERMRITSAGNVGIGVTTNINHPLTVQANSGANAVALVGRSSDNTSSLDFFQNNGTTRLMEFGVSPSAAEFYYDANSPMIFYTNATERMRITSGGNVGIGTNNPGARLDVQGGSIINGNGTIQTAITYATMGIVGTLSNHDLSLYTNNTERMRITSGGSIGIGTNSPDIFGRGDGFDVGISSAGLGASQNMSLQLNAGGSAGRGAQIYMGQGGTRHFTISSNATESTIGTTSNTPLRIETNSVERMRIHSNGGLKFNPQSAAPTAEAGTVYYDSDDNKLKVYNGTSWVDLH